MPSKKKRKAKGKKVVGKGNTKHAGVDGDAVDDATNEQKQAGALDSHMQRLQISGKQQADEDEAVEQKLGALDSQLQRLQIQEKQQVDDEDALLEEAIQLASAEKQEIEEKEKQNCEHGFNPSSRSQERFCVDFTRDIFIDYISRRESGGEYEFISFREAVVEIITKYFGCKRNDSNFECIMSYFLSGGTTYLLEGNYEFARVVAMAAKHVEGAYNFDVDPAKIMELSAEDKHTLVQFFRKQIPCSCLDEKYEEVKSTPKMGYCCNDDCPLPNQRAIRSKMVHCTGCRNVNFCSRECQVAAWPTHKGHCGFL